MQHDNNMTSDQRESPSRVQAIVAAEEKYKSGGCAGCGLRMLRRGIEARDRRERGFPFPRAHHLLGFNRIHAPTQQK